MGLSYLSKKTWHPEKFSNIEQVWDAEKKKDDEARLKQERLKKLKEEKHIEDLKRQQVEAGMIPASTLERLDWMYSDRNAQQQNQQSAEEYLLGKPVDKVDGPKEEPVFAQQNQIDENEAFSRMVEDPMMYIKQMESQKRDNAYNDPIQIQKIKELVDRIEKTKKDKKKLKKEQKKEKKDKHRKEKKKSVKRSRSRSRSQESRDEGDRKHRRERDRHRRYSRDRSNSPTTSKRDRELGPDMSLYADKQKQQEAADRLRRNHSSRSDKPNVSKMSHDEKMQMVAKMQNQADKHHEQKKRNLFGDNQASLLQEKLTAEVIREEQSQNKEAKFLHKVNKDSYMESGLSLDQRLSRSKHYRGRLHNQDE